KAPVPFPTFNKFVKIVSRASWPEPISEPSSRNGADGIKVPRSRISSALSHSRRTRAEMNDQTVIRQSATREGIDDKANDTLRAGHSHHAARNRVDNGANKLRRPRGYECKAKPDSTAPSGSHWYYRVNRTDNRHCWFLGAEGGKVRSQAREGAAHA